MLCKSGANVNSKLSSGITPLILATSKGLLNICKILLLFKAIPTFSVSSGDTALHYAIRNKMTEVSLLILPLFQEL